jgi:soluble lytic murein transglycosylase-like protein
MAWLLSFILNFFNPACMDIKDPKRISQAIISVSEEFQLDPKIVAAVVYQESRGNTCAVRYEPAFFQKYINTRPREELKGYWPASSTIITERTLRAYSFGCMQVMGQVARELGFKGEFLTELTVPEKGIYFGAKKLRKELDKFEGIEVEKAYERALERYNGGGNSRYVPEVLAHVSSGRYRRVLLTEA